MSTTTTKRTILTVAVASRNPVKIDAAREAFEQAFFANNNQGGSREWEFEFEFVGIECDSGVSAQPMGDRETLKGALTRVGNLRDKCPNAAFWVAFEGGCGIDEYDDFGDLAVDTTNNDIMQMQHGGSQQRRSLTVFAWVVIEAAPGNPPSITPCSCMRNNDNDSRGYISKAKSATFTLPDAISRLVLDQGMELGHADDKVFGRSNSKQQTGTVGVLTNDVITRKDYYVQACVLALIPFLNPTYY